MKKIVICLGIFVLFFSTIASSTEKDLLFRLREIEKQLSKEEKKEVRADLFFEKSGILFDIMKQGDDPAAATKILLKAIEIDPDNDDFKKELFKIYYKFWRNRKDDLLKGKIKEEVKKYNNNPNFDYLAGPYEVYGFLKKINNSGIFLTKRGEKERDVLVSYASEYGWFELEGTYDYFELYRADINNDGIIDEVLIRSNDPGEEMEIAGVYDEEGAEITNIVPEGESLINTLAKKDLEKKYGELGAEILNPVRIIFTEEEGEYYFTIFFKPSWQKREEIGIENCWIKFLWEKQHVKLIAFSENEPNI